PSAINNVYLYEEYPHTLRPCREGFRAGQPFGSSALDYWFDRARLRFKQPGDAPAPAPALQGGQSHA
ncbi:MAG: hypothetical protein KIS92_21460, partial [Planctomycetota bacterium]|nr:hypothetical protein [Planctomycetota bacterium]